MSRLKSTQLEINSVWIIHLTRIQQFLHTHKLTHTLTQMHDYFCRRYSIFKAFHLLSLDFIHGHVHPGEGWRRVQWWEKLGVIIFFFSKEDLKRTSSLGRTQMITPLRVEPERDLHIREYQKRGLFFIEDLKGSRFPEEDFLEKVWIIFFR